jgi:hypothetical protein
MLMWIGIGRRKKKGYRQLRHPCRCTADYAEDCEYQQREKDHEFDTKDIRKLRIDHQESYIIISSGSRNQRERGKYQYKSKDNS